MLLNDKINMLRFTLEDDIHIFLAILQNLIDELEQIDMNLATT